MILNVKSWSPTVPFAPNAMNGFLYMRRGDMSCKIGLHIASSASRALCQLTKGSGTSFIRSSNPRLIIHLSGVPLSSDGDTSTENIKAEVNILYPAGADVESPLSEEEAAGKAMLENEPKIGEIQPYMVYCTACTTYVGLTIGTRYCPDQWRHHLTMCDELVARQAKYAHYESNSVPSSLRRRFQFPRKPFKNTDLVAPTRAIRILLYQRPFYTRKSHSSSYSQEGDSAGFR